MLKPQLLVDALTVRVDRLQRQPQQIRPRLVIRTISQYREDIELSGTQHALHVTVGSLTPQDLKKRLTPVRAPTANAADRVGQTRGPIGP